METRDEVLGLYEEWENTIIKEYIKCGGERKSLQDEWSEVCRKERAKKLIEIYKFFSSHGKIDNDLQPILKAIREDKKDRPSGRIYWITVNPKPDIKFDEFKKTVEKQLSRKFVKSYVMAYEQKASEENGEPIGFGFHCHILMERTEESEPSNKIQKYIRAGFKKVCDSQNKNVLYWKICPRQYIEDKINYFIDKNKDDDHIDKQNKQKYDVVWREKENLEFIYFSGVGDLINDYIRISTTL